jgi:hypothetical protein
MRTLKRLLFASTLLLGAAFTAPASAGAFDHFYPVVREPAQGLPNHTVFRPADLAEFGPGEVPVVFWANGGCNQSNFGFTYLLTVLASRGFIVVANGAYDATLKGGTVTPSLLIDAINWVESTTQFKRRVDGSKLAVAGQSCGGLEALVAGEHPRIKTVLALNSGFFPTPMNGYGREQLKYLNKPVLVVNGGPADVAYANGLANYELLVAQGTETYFASNSHAQHSGLWFGIRDGVGDTTMLAQAEKLVVNWLDYILNGSLTAGRYYFGNDCGLCVQPEWFVQSNMDRPDVLRAP